MKLRLLPVLIVAAGLTLTARLGDIWYGWGPVAQAAPAESGPPRTQIAQAEAKTASALDTAGAPDESNTQPPAGALASSGDLLELTDEEIELLQKLSERREEIERRGREVQQRATLLEAAERRIDEKVAELQVLQTTIQNLLVQHDEQEEAQLRSLVKIYESMKPKEAARIFEELDMAVLLEVIERMKERKTAPILAQMAPSKAKAVTLELANRRTLPIAKE